MKKTFLLLLGWLPLATFSQVQQAELIDSWTDQQIPQNINETRYQDAWGAVVNGREIGIITSVAGVHFFDLDGPQGLTAPAAFVPGTSQGAHIIHRDVKTYQHYAYAVSDQGESALQVIDMSGLPESVELVYESDEFIRNAHNIFIDEENARLYAAGGGPFNLAVLSLENPEAPELLTTYPGPGLWPPFVHDLHVRDNVAYLHLGHDGFWVVNLENPENPILLGSMAYYPQQGYNHSGWLAADGGHYFLCDETHGLDMKVLDMSDLSNIKVAATMDARSKDRIEIPHNVYLRDGLLYTAYYYDGLQVYDVSVPEFPRRIAHFDTYTGPHREDYEGAWGVFTLPSGRILVSDTHNGLFFFEAISVPPDNWLTPQFASREHCIGEPFTITARLGSDFETSPVELSTEDTLFETRFTPNHVNPGDLVEIEVAGLQRGWHEVQILAKAGNTEARSRIPLQLVDGPAPPTLLFPPNGSEEVASRPFLRWTPPEEESEYNLRLQLSFSAEDFASNVFYDVEAEGFGELLNFNLDPGASYAWRVSATNLCGTTYSDIFTFTVEKSINSTAQIDGLSITLFPNPASEFLQLQASQALQGPLQVEWWDSSGRLLRTEMKGPNIRMAELSTEGLPDGLYLLRLSSPTGSTSKKVIVKN